MINIKIENAVVQERVREKRCIDCGVEVAKVGYCDSSECGWAESPTKNITVEERDRAEAIINRRKGK